MGAPRNALAFPPKLEDYSSSDDSDEDEEARPLMRDELKSKTLKEMHRRTQRDAAKKDRSATRATRVKQQG